MIRARALAWAQLMVAVAVGLSACTVVSDVKPPQRERDAAAAGSDGGEREADAGGDAPDADQGDNATPAADGGRAVPASDASMPQPDPPRGGAGSSAPVPDSGMDAGMMAAADTGTPAPAGSSVRGKVIDFWRQPIGGVDVTIGDQTVRTNDRGEFEVAEVQRPYTALIRFGVTYGTNVSRNYRWQFRGLTRSDPTLQIDEPPSPRNARVEATFPGVTFPLPDTQRLTYAFGSPHTMWSRIPNSAAAWTEGHVWFGPTVTTGMAHVLVWTVEPSLNALPMRYDMHAARPLVLNDGETFKPAIELTAQTIDTAVVGGRVTTGDLSSTRRNHVFVRWSDNARIKVVTDTPTTNAFSYTVPKLDNATILVAASAGEYSPGPFAVAHKALVQPGQTDLQLAIPSVPSLIAPGENASNVNAETVFEWSGKPQVHVLFVENGTTEAIRVVTTESSARLPLTAAGSLALDPSRPYGFWVETHGEFASVDAAAGEGGFLDDYTPGIAGPMERGEPFGPPRPDGVYAASSSRRFMLAP